MVHSETVTHLLRPTHLQAGTLTRYATFHHDRPGHLVAHHPPTRPSRTERHPILCGHEKPIPAPQKLGNKTPHTCPRRTSHPTRTGPLPAVHRRKQTMPRMRIMACHLDAPGTRNHLPRRRIQPGCVQRWMDAPHLPTMPARMARRMPHLPATGLTV